MSKDGNEQVPMTPPILPRKKVVAQMRERVRRVEQDKALVLAISKLNRNAYA